MHFARVLPRFNDDIEVHDSCAIICNIHKTGNGSHGNVKRTLEALHKMGHRAGDVEGEGDGCGLLTDIPRLLWSKYLEKEGRPSWLAEDKRFFVGHLMLPTEQRSHEKNSLIKQHVVRLVRESGFDLLMERDGLTRRAVLGRAALAQEPLFWQIVGLAGDSPLDKMDAHLFNLALRIEQETSVHVASLSRYTVVYKVRGDSRTLRNYYPELLMPDYTSKVTIGHSRYSTNTWSVFEQAQPFSLLGHNGEINTVQRLREEAHMIGAELVSGASDSHALNRVVETLIHQYGFTLMEAMEMLFQPTPGNVACLPPDLQALYRYYGYAFGPYAQGPAAIVARYADECIFSVDALGLRPLWFGETDKEYFFSSERGVVPLENMLRDPKPLSPGEKMAARLHKGGEVELLSYEAIQQRLLRLASRRFGSLITMKRSLATVKLAHDLTSPESTVPGSELVWGPPGVSKKQESFMAAFGWRKEHRDWIQYLSKHGAEPIGSLGSDEPLASLDDGIRNLADYIKESVAVVTNPAIDRKRESEHFSTQVLVGRRLALSPGSRHAPGEAVVLETPILLGGYPSGTRPDFDASTDIARSFGTMTIEELLNLGGDAEVCRVNCVFNEDESLADALGRLKEEAVEAVRGGARVLVLDDSAAWNEQHHWIDPHLVTAAVVTALRREGTGSDNLRRRCGVVLRSGALRNLHDVVVALGLGADAVNPYLMIEMITAQALSKEEMVASVSHLIATLNRGLEQVTSTMGIHELRGYGKVFGAIGLSDDVAGLLGIKNYCGSGERGLTWERLEEDSRRRFAVVTAKGQRLGRTYHILPRMWKPASRIALGDPHASALFRRMEEVARGRPVALRHLLAFATRSEPVQVLPEEVDAGLTGHDLPFLISSMSFGSQGETAFRAYAEAAYRLNMITLNGEGGEPEDMLGRYPHNRGVQIASGRFGITADALNAVNLIEIKVGQGAKPGEGGLLPGRKVTEKIAKTRHAAVGADLISPSNNHDIYSIEDLAQFIEELKTVNPQARVAVKLPVVPGIGVIAVGVAKAKADIVSLSGFEGGTGAARRHAIRHVGLPIEIGVVESHRALVKANLRNQVEIWADGGVRTPADTVKLICLGANRVGFGTMPMIAIGCTACRQCQFGTCYKGITSQIESMAEAASRGVKHFGLLDFDRAVESLVNFFGAMGDEVRRISADLGFRRVQDLVGRSDLLEQVGFLEEVDLGRLLQVAQVDPSSRADDRMSGRQAIRPRNHLTKLVTEVVMGVIESGETSVLFEDELVGASDRALGTHLSGELVRRRRSWVRPPHHSEETRAYAQRALTEARHGNPGGDDAAAPLRTLLYFHSSAIPGNGLGAFNVDGVDILVEGGAQDGVAKSSSGGRVVVLKGLNYDGKRVDGSVGKSFAYGAIRGTFIVQGNADSRACIRLSGADVVIGGEIQKPLRDHRGFIGPGANVKGFLCEYMTAGRVVVLGDPGPWICSGMTGGVLYIRLNEAMGLDMEAIHRRLARGANVTLREVDAYDESNLRELMGAYIEELNRSMQHEEAAKIQDLLEHWRVRFVKVVPFSR